MIQPWKLGSIPGQSRGAAWEIIGNLLRRLFQQAALDDIGKGAAVALVAGNELFRTAYASEVSATAERSKPGPLSRSIFTPPQLRPPAARLNRDGSLTASISCLMWQATEAVPLMKRCTGG